MKNCPLVPMVMTTSTSERGFQMDKATVVDLTDVEPSGSASSDEAIDLRGQLQVGEAVEVLSNFDHRWTHGFSIAVVDRAMVKLRRGSDGRILPAWFPAAMIRPISLRGVH